MTPHGSSSRRLRWRYALIGLAVLVVGGLLVWSFLSGREAARTEAEAEEPLATRAQITTVNGQVTISLPVAAQQRAGILTAPLTAGAVGGGTGILGYGTVLRLDSLAAIRDAYAAARGRTAQAEAQLAATRREYERRQTLFDQDRNVSAAALERARAAMEADEANATAAAVPLRNLQATALQAWGPVAGHWLVAGSAELTRLLDLQDALVQVTLPPGVAVHNPPDTLPVHTPSGDTVSARYVSTAASANPSIQGMSFFYVAPTTGTLLPGMNVTVSLDAPGASAEGALVPEAAVVWLQGSPWVYVRTTPSTFVRERIRTSGSVDSGDYVVPGLAPGTRVVVRGAQMLLSEEFRAQIQIVG